MALTIQAFEVDVTVRRARGPANDRAVAPGGIPAGQNGAPGATSAAGNGRTRAPIASRGALGTADRVLGRAAPGAPLKPATGNSALTVTPAAPRFIAPPIATPAPKPLAGPVTTQLGPAPSAAGFKPMFKRLASPQRQPPSEIELGARLDAIGTGRPLDEATARHMSDLFGADLGDMRVHTDDRAAGLARDLGAEAFTLGRDVYFADGKFDPASTEGRALLAHELTHVLQQKGLPRPHAQGFGLDDSAQGLEAEAEAMRSTVLAGPGGFRTERLTLEKYTCTYLPNRAPSEAEQARLERIAVRALTVCEEILSAQPDAATLAPTPIEKIELEVPLTLVGTSDEDAARLWGRRMAESVLRAAKAAGAGAAATAELSAAEALVARRPLGAAFVQRADGDGGMTGGQGTSSPGSGPNASVPSPQQVAGRERIDAALKDFTQGNFKDIQEGDWPLANPEERIRLLDKATDRSWVWVGPGDELAIEACWRSFGATLEPAIESHPVIWERSINRGADPESIPETRGKLAIFKGLTIEVARQHLDRNEDAIIAEMKGWGLTPPKHLLRDPSKGGDEKSPAGPLSPDVIKRLEEQRKLARLVIRHERNLKELRTRRVGKMAEPFNPGRPPGEDWEFAGKTTYAWVMETWDRISGEISLILNAYPALYAAYGRDELDKLAFAEPMMHKGGEFYFAGMEQLVETQKQLERSLEGIKSTREKLGDDDAYLDLVPVHRAIYAGRALSASGQRFTQAVMRPIVFDEKEMKDDLAAAARFGIDAALFLLILAGTIGTMGGAAIAVGIAGARAVQAQSRADELAAAHGASVSDDAALVTKSAVTAAQAEAEAAKIDVVITALMEAQGLAIHGLQTGAGSAAKSAEQKLAAAAAEEGGEMGNLRQNLRRRSAASGDPTAPRSVVDPNATVPIAGKQMKSWEGVPHHQRPTELGKVANQTLVANGVPPVDIVISPGRGCKFDYKSWTIQVPERYFSDKISHSDFLDMYASAMHEAEHAMDWYNVARLKAAEHANPGALADSLNLMGPRAREAAERAFRNPMAANDPGRARALQIHESVYGANKDARNAIYKELDASKEAYEMSSAEFEARADARKNLPEDAPPIDKARADYQVAIADEARDKARARQQAAHEKYRALPEEQRAFAAQDWRRDWAGAGLRQREIGRAQKRVDFWRSRLDAAKRERSLLEATNVGQSRLDELDIQIAVSQEKIDKARSDLATVLLQQ